MKNMKNLWKHFIFIYLALFMAPTVVWGAMQSDCEGLYEQHNEVIYDYMLRIEDKVDTYGCSVIPLYVTLIELGDLYSFMDAIDDDPKLILIAEEILSNKNVMLLLARHPAIKQALLNETTTVRFLENISTLFNNRFNYAFRKKLSNKPEYFNYFLTVSKVAKSPEEALSYYDLVRKSISVKQLNLFDIYLTLTQDKLTFLELLNNIKTLQKSLSQKEQDNLILYPQYLGYFFKDKRIYADKAISTVYANVYQEHAIILYKSVYSKYRYKMGLDQVQVALKTLENMSPYLKEQPLKSKEPFKSILKDLVQQGFILQLFKKGLCSDITRDNFAIFGNDNIYNIIKFKQSYPLLYEKLITDSETYRSIFSLFYVANAYNTLPRREWTVFHNLIEELPGISPYPKIAFLNRLEKLGYFKNITRVQDYKRYIAVNSDDSSGKSTSKYAYILLTSYPSQNDLSIMERYYNNKFEENKIRKYLYEMEKMSTDELEDHCFTWYEQAEVYIDIADYSLMAASVAIMPFTGGVSLSYISFVISKRIGKQTLKHMVKSSLKKVNMTIMKKARKLSKSRAETSLKKGAKKVEKKIDKLNDTVSSSSMLFSMGVLLLGSEVIQTKNICEEIK